MLRGTPGSKNSGTAASQLAWRPGKDDVVGVDQRRDSAAHFSRLPWCDQQSRPRSGERATPRQDGGPAGSLVFANNVSKSTNSAHAARSRGRCPGSRPTRPVGGSDAGYRSSKYAEIQRGCPVVLPRAFFSLSRVTNAAVSRPRSGGSAAITCSPSENHLLEARSSGRSRAAREAGSASSTFPVWCGRSTATAVCTASAVVRW